MEKAPLDFPDKAVLPRGRHLTNHISPANIPNIPTVARSHGSLFMVYTTTTATASVPPVKWPVGAIENV